MDIGFIGLGRMGAAMAANLLKTGHAVTVWNRSSEKLEPLLAAGASAAASPRAAAEGDLVITMLADDDAVDDVVFGEEGILGSRAGHVSMSTISVALADRLTDAHRRQDQSFLSAPVFGRPAAAEAGKLFVVAAGEKEAVERSRAAFDAMSQAQFVVGEIPSAANLVKLCGNFMILSTIEAMAEAMTLASKGGVEKSKLLEVLTGTLFSAPVYHTYGELLVEGRFHPAGFAAPLGLKDMRLAAAAAEATRTPMPLLGILRDHLLAAIANEGEDADWSAIACAVERSAGVD